MNNLNKSDDRTNRIVLTGITMALILNGYEPQLTDNIVQPAFSILTNMERIEEIRTREKSGT